MNSMQVSRAVGAVLALAGSAAYAYVPTSNTDADVVLYWGGATASSLSAQELVLNTVCDTDPHLIYVRNEADTNATRRNAQANDWAVACRTAATGTTRSGLPNDKKILVIKRDRGGSGTGVGPLQVNTEFKFLTINATNCPDVITPGVNRAPTVTFFPPGGGAGVTVPLQGCPNAGPTLATLYTTEAYTEMGTSDIEPNKFIGINTPVINDDDGLGNVPYPFLPSVSFGDVQTVGALAFNTPVTLTLFRALQTAQFPATSVCNPANAGYNTVITVPGNIRTDITNGESEACMPSLTQKEINSLLTGQIPLWSQLLDSAGAAVLPALPVQICRRVEGSGSQATINALISQWPCDPDRTDLVVNITQPRNSGAGVFLNSGSGDVANCLVARDDAATSTNRFAIGVLSVEGRNNDKAQAWRYIKIDGVAPTLRNIHAGDYEIWVQQTCQRRNYTTLASNAPVGADDTIANRIALYNQMCGATNPNSLNSLNGLTRINNPTNAANCTSGSNLAQCGSLYTWGQSGWLATATSGLVYDNVLAASTRPINPWTRVTSNVLNACQRPTKTNLGGNSARGVIVTPNPTWTP